MPYKLKPKLKFAYSLVEISIVILSIGLLVAGLIQGSGVIKKAKISSIRAMTENSSVNLIKDIHGWYDTVSQSSFLESEAEDGDKISVWNGIMRTSFESMFGSGAQSDDDNKPTYIGNALTYVSTNSVSLPQLSFDGDDAIILPNGLFPYENSAYTVFIVASSTSGGTVLNSGSSTNINNIGFDSSGNFTVDGGSGKGGSFSVATNGNDIMQIVCHTYDGTISTTSSNKVWVNGVAQTIASVSNGGAARTTASSPVTIGATSDGFNGQIGEIITFSRALSDEERREVEQYLSKKWSIKFPVS